MVWIILICWNQSSLKFSHFSHRYRLFGQLSIFGIGILRQNFSMAKRVKVFSFWKKWKCEHQRNWLQNLQIPRFKPFPISKSEGWYKGNYWRISLWEFWNASLERLPSPGPGGGGGLPDRRGDSAVDAARAKAGLCWQAWGFPGRSPAGASSQLTLKRKLVGWWVLI